MAIWSGWYHDRCGSEPVVISNDGRQLMLRARGAAFAGVDFDVLEPVDGADLPASVRLSNGALCSCTIEWDMPAVMVSGDGETDGVLRCRLELGDPDRSRGGALDCEQFAMTLHVAGLVTATRQPWGIFEEALDDIHRQLPATAYLKMCISCAWSDYSPAGTPLFGGMACFRDAKDAYSCVRSKRAIFEVWNQRTGFVQETFVCPAFQRRGPNAGYRGSFPYVSNAPQRIAE